MKVDRGSQDWTQYFKKLESQLNIVSRLDPNQVNDKNMELMRGALQTRVLQGVAKEKKDIERKSTSMPQQFANVNIQKWTSNTEVSDADAGIVTFEKSLNQMAMNSIKKVQFRPRSPRQQK